MSSVSLPGERRTRKLFFSKMSSRYYFKRSRTERVEDERDGCLYDETTTEHVMIEIDGGFCKRREFSDHMRIWRFEYCVFPALVTDRVLDFKVSSKFIRMTW
jgi:hypothetical protein